MSARGILPALSTCLFLFVFTSPADAREIVDPNPPMQWDEMMACELAVVGKYEKHDGMTLHLCVVKVLKGKDTKPDDILPVALEHWYSIETGLTGWDRWNRGAKPDGVPKLCYKMQFMNPGPLETYKVIPDVREPAVYFFPDARKPALSRRSQVQLAVFADGWEQALTGKPMDPEFRLMQNIDEDLRHDAIEELARARDPGTLGQLVEWTTKPPVPAGVFSPNTEHARYNAVNILAAVGDRKGDVYGPLMAWFLGLGKKAEGRHVAELLGRLDAKRAFGDLSKVLREGIDWDKYYVTRHLALLRSEEAVGLCIDLLQEPKLAEPARVSLHLALNYSVPEDVRARIGPLLPFARARLLAAFKSGKISADFEQSIRSSLPSVFWGAGPIPAAPEIEAALFGASDEKGREVLNRIRAAPDPRFIPVLVRALVTYPPGGASPRAGTVYTVMATYTELFPNTVRKELENRGQLPLLRKVLGHPYIDKGLLYMIGGSPTLEELQASRPISPEVFKRVVSPELAAAYRKYVAGIVEEEYSHSYRHLLLLMKVDPAATMPLLKKAVARRNNYTHSIRAGVLALAIARGIAAPVDELIGEVKNAAEGEHSYYANSSSYRYLLVSGDARAYKFYLEALDGCKRIVPNPYHDWGRSVVDPQYEGMLWELSEEHGADFFTRVLDLATSPKLAERRVAESQLRRLNMDFGYSSNALEPTRTEVLRQIRPLAGKLAPMSPLDRDRYLLELHGVRLDGADWKAWLPALVEATGNPAGPVSETALDLVQDLVKQGKTENLLSYPTSDRPRIVQCWLADRGLEPKP